MKSKLFGKSLALIMALAVMLSALVIVPITASAENSVIWDGSVATGYAAGSGTVNDPYLISNGTELAYLVSVDSATAGKYYRLTSDIYLNDVSTENWYEAEGLNSWFKYANGIKFGGYFDGTGYTVYGLYYKNEAVSSNTFVALFPATTGTVGIKNLNVSDLYIYLNQTANTLESNAAGMVSNTGGPVSFQGCVVKNADITILNGAPRASGASGFATYGASKITVDTCAFIGRLSAPRAGAFFGNFWNPSPDSAVSNSYAIGAQYTGWWYYNPINSYGTHMDPLGSERNGILNIISDASSIKGEGAKEIMTKLDWQLWDTTEEYPMPKCLKFAGGNGTASNPYIISNKTELIALTKNTYPSEGLYYELANDIYLNDVSADTWYENAENWYEYNDTTDKFGGTLDGNGYTIYGLCYNKQVSKATYFGLFPKAYNTEVIKNLILSDVYVNIEDISGNNNEVEVGLFCGFVYGSSVDSSKAFTFSKCIVKNADITVSGTTKGSAAGFITYGSRAVTADNCAFIGTISATKRYGAFFGDIWDGAQTVSNSFAVGTCFSSYRPFTASSCYGTETESNITQITANGIKGAAAKTAMPGLVWNYGWTITENDYPTIAVVTYAGGVGTEISPFVINDLKTLYKLVLDTETNGKYYILASDIAITGDDADNNWFTAAEVPVFAGTLDGNGHTISGLRFNGSGHIGLFPKASNSTIKNLTISDFDITTLSNSSDTYVGAFVGNASGKVNIVNCVADETVTVSCTDSTKGYVAGFVGGNTGSAEISYSAFLGTLEYAEGARHGAFMANLWNNATRIITNCFAVDYRLNGFGNLTAQSGNYTSGDVTTDSTTIITTEQMKGLNALVNMPELEGFVATNSYPTHYFNGTKGRNWSGLIAESYASGSGKSGDPYMIETPEQFAKLVCDGDTLGKYFKLACAIDLSGANWFDSNNKEATVFAGTLDGNGYAVKGLTYESNVAGNVFTGLFPRAGKAVVRGLVINDSTITLNSTMTAWNATYVGGIFGFIVDNVRIENSIVGSGVVLTNNLIDENETGRTSAMVGGFIGGSSAGNFDINGCVFLGTLVYDSNARHGAFTADPYSSQKRYIRNSVSIGGKFSSHWSFEASNNYGTFEETGVQLITADTVIDLGDKWLIGKDYPILKQFALKSGDVNGDYSADSTDLVAMSDVLLKDKSEVVTDFNLDGTTDILDIVRLKKIYAGYSFGDRETALLDTITLSGNTYSLVWNDEFDSAELDTAKWDRNNRITPSNEFEMDFSDATAYVADGKLQMTSTVSLDSKKYVAPASVSTRDTMSFKYGYLEMRAKVPFGKGLWPSFWASSSKALNSKQSPDYTIEVDFFEQFASDNSIRSNLHKWGNSHIQFNAIPRESYVFESKEVAEEYHTYGFLWTPTAMTMYVDGVAYMSYDITGNTGFAQGETSSDMSGFDTTLAIILNNHLFTESSSYKPYAGCEAALENMNGDYTVDYVRLYQTTGGVLNVADGDSVVTTVQQ